MLLIFTTGPGETKVKLRLRGKDSATADNPRLAGVF